MGTNDLVDGPGFASNENEKVENERRKKEAFHYISPREISNIKDVCDIPRETKLEKNGFEGFKKRLVEKKNGKEN